MSHITNDQVWFECGGVIGLQHTAPGILAVAKQWLKLKKNNDSISGEGGGVCSSIN